MAVLPEALKGLLEEIHESEEKERFADLFNAAAEAMDSLSDFELSSYELEGEQSPNLDLWEFLAPALRDTINEVNKFLDRALVLFPVGGDDAPQEKPKDQALADALAELDKLEAEMANTVNMAIPVPAPPLPASAVGQDATDSLFAIAQGLRSELKTLGSGMRRAVMNSSRWQLLDHLGAFRGKFRAGIGEMVYAAASTIIDVRREDVVPYYHHDLEHSLALRRELADFRLQVEMANRLVARGTDVRALAGRVVGYLDEFKECSAYAHMRAGDKGELVDSGHRLARLVKQGGGDHELQEAVEGLARHLESLLIISQREHLRIHDHAVLEDLNEHLTAVVAAVTGGDAAEANFHAVDGVAAAEQLYGWSPQLDHTLRLLRRVPVTDASALELLSIAVVLRGAVSQMQSKAHN